ncbi:MAG: ABC transporter ATP-binding protein [Clostridia bacterium]|nr:ABC transporter ATP-binding protein [Clostridia bacterium]
MLKRFLKYYKPHKRIFILDMLASLATALIGLAYPVVTRRMLNDLIPNRNYRLIVVYGISLLGLYFISMLLQYFIQYKGHIMGVKMQAQMRSDMFRHLETLPFSFYDNNETGKIMSRLTNDLFDITELAHHGPENIIISTVSVVISFIYLSTINIWLSLIIFACVPLLILVSTSTRKKMREAFKKSKQAIAKINSSLQSSISGIRITKAFNNSDKEIEKFEEGNTEFKEANKDAYKALGIFHSSTAFITNVFNVVVLIAGGLFLYSGKITFADYSAFIVSIHLFISPITTLIRFVEQFQNGVTGFERFLQVMDTKPEYEKSDAKPSKRLSGNIEFKNVYCSYTESKEVLKDVSFEIRKGETFALVGPSGGGKTTVCHLIPHFYNINSGEILIDGINIEDITLDSLRRNIGIVQQDIYLFNSSIKDNILYGCYDATDEQVTEAAKRAGIHDYIMSLENGYETVIGERGVRLSGGQKQRLCIARVFLKNPPILILDEATSALDSVTEMMIQKSINELCIGRTTVIVAHRLSTIKDANRIAVISQGKVAEIGSHSELMQKNGMYAELYNKQYSEATAQ